MSDKPSTHATPEAKVEKCFNCEADITLEPRVQVTLCVDCYHELKAVDFAEHPYPGCSGAIVIDEPTALAEKPLPDKDEPKGGE